MIQVRDVPEWLTRELKRRAAATDMTLTDYVQQVLEREARRPTREELRRRIAALPPIESAESSAQIIRRARGER